MPAIPVGLGGRWVWQVAWIKSPECLTATTENGHPWTKIHRYVDSSTSTMAPVPSGTAMITSRPSVG